MTVGISTYAFMWRMSNRMPRPMDLGDVLRETAKLGLPLLQVCDYTAIEGFTRSQLRKFRDRATDLGIALELGTKGIAPAQLRRYREIASELGATLLRSMLYSSDYRPSLEQAEHDLRDVISDFEQHGITLALETYEQVSGEALLALTDSIDSKHLGICLDVGNMVAALETPNGIAELTAPRVVNLHIKDFSFTRNDGMVGFTFAGCPLGEGLLDYTSLTETVRPNQRNINQIIELWLPWQGDPATTWTREDEWTRHAVDYLTQRQHEVP